MYRRMKRKKKKRKTFLSDGCCWWPFHQLLSEGINDPAREQATWKWRRRAGRTFWYYWVVGRRQIKIRNLFGKKEIKPVFMLKSAGPVTHCAIMKTQNEKEIHDDCEPLPILCIARQGRLCVYRSTSGGPLQRRQSSLRLRLATMMLFYPLAFSFFLVSVLRQIANELQQEKCIGLAKSLKGPFCSQTDELFRVYRFRVDWWIN